MNSATGRVCDVEEISTAWVVVRRREVVSGKGASSKRITPNSSNDGQVLRIVVFALRVGRLPEADAHAIRTRVDFSDSRVRRGNVIAPRGVVRTIFSGLDLLAVVELKVTPVIPNLDDVLNRT